MNVVQAAASTVAQDMVSPDAAIAIEDVTLRFTTPDGHIAYTSIDHIYANVFPTLATLTPPPTSTPTWRCTPVGRISTPGPS